MAREGRGHGAGQKLRYKLTEVATCCVHIVLGGALLLCCRSREAGCLQSCHKQVASHSGDDLAHAPWTLEGVRSQEHHQVLDATLDNAKQRIQLLQIIRVYENIDLGSLLLQYEFEVARLSCCMCFVMTDEKMVTRGRKALPPSSCWH